MIETLLKYLLGFVAVLFGVFCMYFLFFVAPVSIYTEAKCLRAGYPENRVSIGLESYCMNLDGSVTVKVDKLETLGK